MFIIVIIKYSILSLLYSLLHLVLMLSTIICHFSLEFTLIQLYSNLISYSDLIWFSIVIYLPDHTLLSFLSFLFYYLYSSVLYLYYIVVTIVSTEYSTQLILISRCFSKTKHLIMSSRTAEPYWGQVLFLLSSIDHYKSI